MYSKYLKEQFEKFKNYVTKLLIDYYGKQFEEIIIERLNYNSNNFIFYGNLSDHRIENDSVKDKYENDFFRLFNTKYDLTAEIDDPFSYYSGFREIIYSTNSMDYDDNVNEKIKESMNFQKMVTFRYYDLNDLSIKPICLIPIFSDDRAIIHEMIHFITYLPLFVTDSSFIGKTGLCSNTNIGEKILEEIITELEARRIYDNCDKSTILISQHYNIKSTYALLFDLVVDFYDGFKDEITFARFTMNKNYLLEIIGRDNYGELISIIGECYSRRNFDIENIRELKIIVQDLVAKMIKNRNNQKLSLRKKDNN
jgi:hypothetical protein